MNRNICTKLFILAISSIFVLSSSVVALDVSAHVVKGALYINGQIAEPGIEIQIRFSDGTEIGETFELDGDFNFNIGFAGHDNKTGTFVIIYDGVEQAPDVNKSVYVENDIYRYYFDFYVTVPNHGPIADANGAYTAGINETITFDASGSTDDGEIVGYRWDFNNNGTYDTEWLASPKTTYSYSEVGQYTVKLQVKDDDGSTDTDTALVYIGNQMPTAKSNGPYTGRAGENITFDASESYDIDDQDLIYRWDFDGDGTYDTPGSSSPTYVYKYSKGGEYIATLEVSDGELTDVDETTATITPVAKLAKSYVGYIGKELSFNADQSSGDGLQYRWDFEYVGDENMSFSEWSSSPSTTHTYTKSGNFTVFLQVKDTYSNLCNATADLKIKAIMADAGGPYESYVDEQVTFDGSSSAGSSLQYRWDFDYNGTALSYDTSWSSSSEATYTYNSTGTYTIALAVKDSGGNETVDYDSVLIKPKDGSYLDADAGGPYVNFFEGDVVDFDGGDSIGEDLEYRWDFTSDGTYDTTYSSSSTATNIYSQAGTYTVKLQIKNSYNSDTATASVIIKEKESTPHSPSRPTIAVPGDGEINKDVQISIRSTDSDKDDVKYVIDWGDGETTTTEYYIQGISQTVTHKFSDAGMYTIEAYAVDETNRQSSKDTETILIDADYAGLLGFMLDTDSDGEFDSFKNSTSGQITDIKADEGGFLIDEDGDGKYDHFYDSTTLMVSSYEGSSDDESFPLMYLVLVLVIVAIVIGGIVVFSRRSGKNIFNINMSKSSTGEFESVDEWDLEEFE